MTAVVIDLHTRQAITATVTTPAAAVCAALVLHGIRICGAPLEPARCGHPTCTEVADPDQRCAGDRTFCCGCCWLRADETEGRMLWPR